MLSDEIQRGIYIFLLLVIRAEQTGGDPDLFASLCTGTVVMMPEQEL